MRPVIRSVAFFQFPSDLGPAGCRAPDPAVFLPTLLGPRSPFPILAQLQHRCCGKPPSLVGPLCAPPPSNPILCFVAFGDLGGSRSAWREVAAVWKAGPWCQACWRSHSVSIKQGSGCFGPKLPRPPCCWPVVRLSAGKGWSKLGGAPSYPPLGLWLGSFLGASVDSPEGLPASLEVRRGSSNSECAGLKTSFRGPG